jgi:hypothetical protein
MEFGEAICEPGDVATPPNDPEGEDEEKAPRRVRVRISLFFDGTGNNRSNTSHRLLTEKAANAAKKQREGRELSDQERLTTEEEGQLANSQRVMSAAGADTTSSYYNDYSNVSRLEKYVDGTGDGYDHYFKLYIDGIGTIDSQKDSFRGNLAGTGVTGVTDRVDQALSKVIARICKEIPSDYVIDELSVDTFGFSRGASAARYCVYRVLHRERRPYPKDPKLALKERLEINNHEVEKVEVRAVGVFDTVSALGIAYIDISDVPFLRLDSVRQAKAVLHLAASEEYRYCFSLTNIQSATRSGKGVEIFLPGAHSDIGGGYTRISSEDQTICEGSISPSVAEYLLENGWYSDEELKYRKIDMGRRSIEDVVVARQNISNQYSFIPLRIMADFAREQSLIVNGQLSVDFEPNGIPSGLRDRIDAYVDKAKAQGGSKSEDWQTNDPALRSLRHGFLHFSSRQAMGFHLRTKDAGGVLELSEKYPTRKVFNG